MLHFIGHGDYDVVHDEGALVLVGPDGQADRVEASRLADLLAEAQPMPRLVVLNSCSSGQAGTNNLFSGAASGLVRSGISAVAAMQFAISDTAAIAFARGFYTAIAHGRSIDEAARSGRIAILGAPRSLEWATPVLYVRGEAGLLFALNPSVGASRTVSEAARASAAWQPTEPAWRRQAQLRALYVAARAELRVGHFDEAISLLDDLITLDPAHSDAARLRDTVVRSARAADTSARKQQEISDLQAELRYHADAGQWQAVLDADAELTRLDPGSSDPGGLATDARKRLGITRIEPAAGQSRSGSRMTDIGMSSQEWHRLRDAMGSVFDSRTSAFNVLDRIDYPRERRPSFGDNPQAFWGQIFNTLDNGIIATPRRQLLLAASTVYPFNPVFLELCQRYGVVVTRDWGR